MVGGHSYVSCVSMGFLKGWYYDGIMMVFWKGWYYAHYLHLFELTLDTGSNTNDLISDG